MIRWRVSLPPSTKVSDPSMCDVPHHMVCLSLMTEACSSIARCGFLCAAKGVYLELCKKHVWLGPLMIARRTRECLIEM